MFRLIRQTSLALALTLPVSAALAAPPGPETSALARNCAHCHGIDGRSASDMIPHLGGQNEAYLLATLKAFKQDKRPSVFMGRLTRGYSDPELEEVARYFARQPWSPPAQTTSPQRVANGEAMAQKRCAACHSERGLPVVENTPRLAGQQMGYIKTELDRFLTPKMRQSNPGMFSAIEGLNDLEIDELAQYFGSQQ